MQLIKCRKCGALVSTQDTFVEYMMAEVERLNKLAEKAARGKNKSDRELKTVYAQQSAQVYKMIRQIIHLTAQMDEHARTVLNEKSVLIHYLLQNNLITMEKIHELDLIGRERTKLANEKDRKQIEAIYGDFCSETVNRTKADPTARKAIK